MSNGDVDPIARMKQGMRWMRSLGDYGELAPMLEPAAAAIVEASDVQTGSDLLDVAAGSGNVAVIAARAGARVHFPPMRAGGDPSMRGRTRWG